MDNKLLISVITTTYNSRRMLLDCVESVRGLELEYEHIIVDDGSDDGTIALITELKKNDPRLKYINNGKIGRGPALNVGVGAACGEYICILDADDYLLPVNVNGLFKFLNTENISELLNADVLFGQKKIRNYVDIDKNIDAAVDNNFSGIINFSSLDGKILYFYNPIPNVAVFIKKIIFDSLGYYNEQRISQFDWEMWLRIYNCGLNFIEVDLILGIKRIHTRQAFENNKHFNYVMNGCFLALNSSIKSKKFFNVVLALLGGIIRVVWACLPRTMRVNFWKRFL